jgi:hypothetical protein
MVFRFWVVPQSEGESALNTHPELGSPASPSHLLFPQPLVVCCRPRSFVLLSHSSRTRPLHFQPLLTLVLYPWYCRCYLCFSVHLVYFHGPTGRRPTAEEYNQTAEENGWVPGGHEEEEDSIQQTKGKPTGR